MKTALRDMVSGPPAWGRRLEVWQIGSRLWSRARVLAGPGRIMTAIIASDAAKDPAKDTAKDLGGSSAAAARLATLLLALCTCNPACVSPSRPKMPSVMPTRAEAEAATRVG